MRRKNEGYVLATIVDNDDLFHRTKNAILLNELLVEEKVGNILEMIYDDSEPELASVASCPMGCTVGDYYSGSRCKDCGELVTEDLGTQIRNDVWFGTPSRIDKVLHPAAYRTLSQWMGKIEGSRGGKISKLDIMLDPAEPIPESLQSIITGQGFVWFYKNFDYIIEKFMELGTGLKGRRDNHEIKMFLEANGERIWTTKFPLVSRVLQPVIRSASNRYPSKVTKDVVEAIVDLGSSALQERLDDTPLKVLEKRFFKIYSHFNEYLKAVLRDFVAQKTGVARKHVFGQRLHCTVRTVTVPILGKHDLDELHLCWSAGVSLYQVHLIAMLEKTGKYTHIEAFRKTCKAISVYDYEIDQMIQKMIRSSKFGGVPVLLNRNPILKEPGIIYLRNTVVYPNLKEDPNKEWIKLRRENPGVDDYELGIEEDKYSLISNRTLAVSPGILSGPNIDFDGDEINFTIIPEEDAVKVFKVMHPSNRMLDTKDHAIGKQNVNLSAQQSIMLSGWANAPIGDCDDNF